MKFEFALIALISVTPDASKCKPASCVGREHVSRQRARRRSPGDGASWVARFISLATTFLRVSPLRRLFLLRLVGALTEKRRKPVSPARTEANVVASRHHCMHVGPRVRVHLAFLRRRSDSVQILYKELITIKFYLFSRLTPKHTPAGTGPS